MAVTSLTHIDRRSTCKHMDGDLSSANQGQKPCVSDTCQLQCSRPTLTWVHLAS